MSSDNALAWVLIVYMFLSVLLGGQSDDSLNSSSQQADATVLSMVRDLVYNLVCITSDHKLWLPKLIGLG